jgi:hypothetical protein
MMVQFSVEIGMKKALKVCPIVHAYLIEEENYR